MQKAIEVIFTEDKDLLRNAFIEALKDYPIKVIGEARNGKELLKLLSNMRPDVVILDLEMPIMNGSETMNQLMKKFPDTKVLILTMYNEPLLIENFMARGARGFVPKDEIAGDITILLSALKTISGGEIYIPTKMADTLRFTNRHKDMMPLIFDGKTNDQIAEEIGLTKRSVEKCRQKIYEKAGANKAIDFYKYAFSRGLQFMGRLCSKPFGVKQT